MSGHVVCIVGWSGAGKTTLLEKLVPALRRRGLSVAVLKHSSHAHALQPRGSDTDRLLNAGAGAVGLAVPGFVQWTRPINDAGLADELTKLESGYDLVLVEGWKHGPFPRIEVWREGLERPLAETDPDIRAVGSDTPVASAATQFRPDDVDALAGWIAGKERS